MREAPVIDLVATEPKRYGIEKFGRLRRVLLHRPDEAIRLVTPDNREFFLFSDVPDPERYLEEHRAYQCLLEGLGVEVNLLTDHVRRNVDLVRCLPNLAYLHDIAVVSSHGAIISKMASRGRCHEEICVREALTDLGVPTLWEADEGETFEGCLLVSPTTVFVADTERHSPRSIEKFIRFILRYFPEVIYAVIPQARRYMHPDMVLNRVTEQLLVWYPPAFRETYLITAGSRRQIELPQLMRERGISLVPLSDHEQQHWGSSFVPLAPGEIINYDISLQPTTLRLLEREGVTFHHFHPDALLAGGGSLRCITLRIWRDG